MAPTNQTHTLETLANHLDAEVRNTARGMTLGFVRSVDTRRETVTFENHGETTTRSGDSVLGMLNGPGSWVVEEVEN